MGPSGRSSSAPHRVCRGATIILQGQRLCTATGQLPGAPASPDKHEKKRVATMVMPLLHSRNACVAGGIKIGFCLDACVKSQKISRSFGKSGLKSREETSITPDTRRIGRGMCDRVARADRYVYGEIERFGQRPTSAQL